MMVNVIRLSERIERIPPRRVEELSVATLVRPLRVNMNAVMQYVRRFDEIARRYSVLVHSFPDSKQRDDLLLDIGDARQIIRATLVKLSDGRTIAVDRDRLCAAHRSSPIQTSDE